MLIVCFTTIPSRIKISIKNVHKVISKQTRKPDRIILFLPLYSIKEKCKYIIPEYTYDIEIIRCEDYGPGTKLYPIIFEDMGMNTQIITIDDDINYEANCFEMLEKYSNLYPRRGFTGSGWIAGDNIFNCFGRVRNNSTLKQVDIIQGYSSCIYRKWMLKDDIISKLTTLHSKDCYNMFKNDDIWISGYLDSKNIRKFVVPNYHFSDTSISYINGISNNLFKYLFHFYYCVKYFKNKKYFKSEQTAPLFTRLGSYITLLLFIFLIIFRRYIFG